MNIALLAPLWKKVPPEKYGGSELVVADLAQGLTKLGHKVTTFACGGSLVSGKLVSVISRPMYELVEGFNWKAIQPYEFLSFYELGKRVKKFDIAHNHMGFHPVAFAPLLPIPMITTLHSSLAPDFPFLAQRFRNENFVSISNAQRKVAPYLKCIATVYHGIRTKQFKPNYSIDEDYLVFIGSLIPNKGVDLAVRAARELGENLIIAGDIRPEFKDFVKKKIMPYIDGKKIKYVGEINHLQKNKLLANAKAFIFPVQWNEAFGLVMAESLACGTPVVAFGNGSVPEIVRHGKTGFVVKNYVDLKKYIKQVKNISRKQCRLEAEKRFDYKIMATGYVNIYKKLIEKQNNI